MERNYGAEIDSLNAEISSLKKELQELGDVIRSYMHSRAKQAEAKPMKRVCQMKDMHPDKRLSGKMEELCTLTDEKGVTGMITYLGVYCSGGRQSNWIRNEVCTDDLLALIENSTAEKVLNCIGSSDRLNILLALLKKPMSVAEIVNECGLNSTGQAYHHMKPLLAADLIIEDENNKGVYVVQSHKVQGIIMLLAGICDLVDETYSKGTWDSEE
ncbi:MAG TPA: winged helix-turn-helix domain-containing protein [Clostridiales bacterium]|nr:winged helix-turn-helix domain-containing protein [Clostridiales bacterium]HOL90801.1 winged helix-turn-helix domain-containing protein [Clostridiales bacterium]HPP34614.1 winged helix-turn-helix domain-containing protein [Clostridiales bacterium]